MTPQKQKQKRRKQQDVVSDDDGCDESKCVSKGLSYDLYNNSFTCYSNDNGYKGWAYFLEDYYYPMMCADGYKPRIVESEQNVLDGWERTNQYFTCCPPGLSTETNISRHCSDPIVNFIEPYIDDYNHYQECPTEPEHPTG